MKSSFNNPVKNFFLLFLPLLLLFTAITVSFLLQDLKAKKTILMAKEKKNIEILRRVANDDIKSIASDLFFLSVNPLLHQIIERSDPVTQQKLADDFKRFCSRSTLYDQIRFLDENGMEKIRINFSQNQAVIVPEDKLQNKGKRYYFADTFALEPGHIFVSPFDLNIEHGQIELPLKPMIRFGTPVVDLNGKKRGIVLLNYLGAKLIENLKEAVPDSDNPFSLLNSEGYWLKGLNMEDEWGFMYSDRKDRTFALRYPETWRQISMHDEGQFSNHQGIYTFTTFYLLSRGMLSSSGSAEAFQSSTSVLSGKEYHWKIVSLITKEKLKELRAATILNRLPYAGVGLFLIALISLLFSLVIERRGQVIEERLRREKLQAVLEMAGAVCHELNQPLMIISGYSELLLYDISKESKQYKKLKEIAVQVDRLGVITNKLMNITQYKTKNYLQGKIIDINASSDDEKRQSQDR